jgi:hypothetical protein
VGVSVGASDPVRAAPRDPQPEAGTQVEAGGSRVADALGSANTAASSTPSTTGGG